MSGHYGRTEIYTSRLPVREQLNSLCTNCTTIYAGIMLGLLTGQKVEQLSQLDMWKHQEFDSVTGVNTINVCAEHLWPATLAYGPDTWLRGISDYNNEQRISGTPPDAIAVADAANHKIEFADYLLPRTPAEVMAVIDAGHVMSLFVPPNHLVVLWDYWGDAVNGGGLGLDSRSADPTPYQKSWPQIIGYVQQVFKKATFTGVVAPRRINPYMPNNNVALVQALRGKLLQMGTPGAPLLNKVNSVAAMTADDIGQMWGLVDTMTASVADKGYVESMVNSLVADRIIIIQPAGGNTQMLIDSIKADANALVLGQITQAQIDAGRAHWEQLVPDFGSVLIPPTGQITPGTGSIDDHAGHVFTITSWGAVAINGNTSNGEYAKSGEWNTSFSRFEITGKDWPFAVKYWNGSTFVKV